MLLPPYCSAYFLTHTNVHTIKHTGKSRSQITSSQSFLGEIPWNFNKLYTTMLTLEERSTTFNWISMDGYRRNSCFPLIITVFRFKIKNHLCLDILVFFSGCVYVCEYRQAHAMIHTKGSEDNYPESVLASHLIEVP